MDEKETFADEKFDGFLAQVVLKSQYWISKNEYFRYLGPKGVAFEDTSRSLLHISNGKFITACLDHRCYRLSRD